MLVYIIKHYHKSIFWKNFAWCDSHKFEKINYNLIKEYKLRSPGFYKKLSDLAEKLLILMVTFLGAQIAFWSTFFLINGGSFVGNIQIVIWTSVVCNCLGFFLFDLHWLLGFCKVWIINGERITCLYLYVSC